MTVSVVQDAQRLQQERLRRHFPERPVMPPALTTDDLTQMNEMADGLGVESVGRMLLWWPEADTSAEMNPLALMYGKPGQLDSAWICRRDNETHLGYEDVIAKELGLTALQVATFFRLHDDERTRPALLAAMLDAYDRLLVMPAKAAS